MKFTSDIWNSLEAIGTRSQHQTDNIGADETSLSLILFLFRLRWRDHRDKFI